MEKFENRKDVISGRFTSSVIDKMMYMTKEYVLIIKMKNGKKYMYVNVDTVTAGRLFFSHSKGTAYNSMVKGKYLCVQLGE